LGNTIGKAMLDKWVDKWVAPLLGAYFSHRQKQEWLWDDGMTKSNSHDVRDMMHLEFDLLDAVFLSSHTYLVSSQVQLTLAILSLCLVTLVTTQYPLKSCAVKHPIPMNG
jgi:hypothetical protein